MGSEIVPPTKEKSVYTATLPTPPKAPPWLALIDANHKVDVTRYFRQVVSFDDLAHNCAYLGYGEASLIRKAERANIPHCYNAAIKKLETKEDFYLFLKKLYDKGLMKTQVFEECVGQIALRNKNQHEDTELQRAVGWDPDIHEMLNEILPNIKLLRVSMQ